MDINRISRPIDLFLENKNTQIIGGHLTTEKSIRYIMEDPEFRKKGSCLRSCTMTNDSIDEVLNLNVDSLSRILTYGFEIIGMILFLKREKNSLINFDYIEVVVYTKFGFSENKFLNRISECFYKFLNNNSNNSNNSNNNNNNNNYIGDGFQEIDISDNNNCCCIVKKTDFPILVLVPKGAKYSKILRKFNPELILEGRGARDDKRIYKVYKININNHYYDHIV